MLSVVVPADPGTIEIRRSLQFMEQVDNLEIICVGLKEARSRAERLNIGFHRAVGKVILFHHPRSVVDPEGIRTLIDHSLNSTNTPFWGGFTHRFDTSHPVLSFTSWYSNKIRFRRGILYLDHGIFFHRNLWIKDIPPVEIFEDTLLSHEFRKICKPIILPHWSTTSAIRFQKNGVLKQALVNQVLKIGFHLNISNSIMNRFYEKGLDLNSSERNKHDGL